MCGIVGYITVPGKTGVNDRSKFLRQALIIDTLRGDDSTGVFAVGHENLFEYKDCSPYWLKQVGGGHDFVDTKEYWENFVDVEPYRCVVGHNRAATVGSVDADSAHPFQEGPITLVHNGTLTSTHGLPTSLHQLKEVTVDSHAICHNLALHGVEEVVKELHGAFALVWHDARDDSINVVRNSQRPLHFALDKTGKTLYFMSEGEMLSLLDGRIKLGLSSIHYPGEGVYLKWLKDTPLDQPITKELELYDYWSGRLSAAYTTKRGSWIDAWNGSGGGYGGYNSYDEDYYSDSWRHDLPPKSPARDPKENWVSVGGRRKEVPMLLQEKLMDEDVTVEDRFEFTPHSVGPSLRDPSRQYVIGDIPGVGNGIIYSVSANTASSQSKRWTVRIVGVKKARDGKRWFICRLMATFVTPNQIMNG